MSTPAPVSDERLFDVMYQCRAIRRFTDRPVPEELLVQLVDAALHGPSSSNAQNWSFVIVRGAQQKQRVKAVWGRSWALYRESIGAAPLRPGEDGAARARMLRAADHLLDRLEDVPAIVFVGVLPDTEAERGLRSPWRLVKHLGVAGTARFVVASPRIGAMAKGSTAYPAVQNLLLAARALGLGAVMTTQHLFVPGRFERVIGAPRSFTLAAIVPVGWPDAPLGPTRRPDPRSVISWERWDGSAAADAGR